MGRCFEWEVSRRNHIFEGVAEVLSFHEIGWGWQFDQSLRTDTLPWLSGLNKICELANQPANPAIDRRIFKAPELVWSNQKKYLGVVHKLHSIFGGMGKERDRPESWDDLEAEERGSEGVEEFKMAKNVERSLWTSGLLHWMKIKLLSKQIQLSYPKLGRNQLSFINKYLSNNSNWYSIADSCSGSQHQFIPILQRT